MDDQVVSQAIVVNRSEIDEEQLPERIALFTPDGSPIDLAALGGGIDNTGAIALIKGDYTVDLHAADDDDATEAVVKVTGENGRFGNLNVTGVTVNALLSTSNGYVSLEASETRGYLEVGSADGTSFAVSSEDVPNNGDSLIWDDVAKLYKPTPAPDVDRILLDDGDYSVDLHAVDAESTEAVVSVSGAASVASLSVGDGTADLMVQSTGGYLSVQTTTTQVLVELRADPDDDPTFSVSSLDAPADGDLLVWDGTDKRYKPTTLAALKALLDALV